jgi:hypothetical protein
VVLFVVVTSLVTWLIERPLLRESLGALRSGDMTPVAVPPEEPEPVVA